MELDKKDSSILTALAANARMPLTQLSKRVGLSREVVDYRLKQLVKKGIVQSFCTETDVMRLGYTKYVVYLEIIGVDEKREAEIIDFVRKDAFTSWVVTTPGKWSIIFDVYAQTITDLDEKMGELKKSIGRNLGKQELATIKHYEHFHEKPWGLINQQKAKKNAPTNKGSIDDTDLRILHLLSNNARTEYVQLSEKLKLTPEAISRRIRRLEHEGVIKAFYLVIDLNKLGFDHYNIQLLLNNAASEEQKRLTKYLSNHPQVTFIYEPISGWDLECGVIMKGAKELHDFIRELRKLHPMNIHVRDIIPIYEGIKSTAPPEGVFNYKG
ncbi:Lrp/AsnC family transcriptional regulator [Candidatus Woesearchaeota archaeon]|nr:Lrp/AsnC family transcriptional regulator [Candidatus Woesearchaeota archaeon]